MPTINELTATTQLSGSDLFPVFSQSNGDARKVSLTNLLTYIQTEVVAIDDKITQYAAPSATGFLVTVTDSQKSVWLIIAPVDDYAAGSILLPAVANTVDKQELLVNCTHDVDALSIGVNGATVTGAPTSITAGDFFRLRFDGVMKVWYRVG